MKVPLIYISIVFSILICCNNPTYAQDNKNLSSSKNDDTLKITKPIDKLAKRKTTIKDTSAKDNSDDQIILDILDGLNKSNRIITWYLDPSSYSLEVCNAVDTSLFFPHFLIPLQKNLETITYLGNIGSPIKSDHFFSQNHSYKFLFSRYYLDYKQGTMNHYHYHVKRPLTTLGYSMGGKKSKEEQTLHVLHTQNVNKYLNVGITFDYYGTKGIFKRQLTRDNIFTAFASYYRNNFSFQGAFSYNRFFNQENGGLTSDFFIQDTILESELVPFKLLGAQNEIRERSFSGIVGYNIINRKVTVKDEKGQEKSVLKPIFSVKAVFDYNRHARTYTDGIDNDTTHYSYYEYFYVSKKSSHDSVRLLTYESTLIGEISQLAKFPGLPGLRFWISNIRGSYYYFKPGDFIHNRKDDELNSNHFGIGTFSYSPYLSYSGTLRMYFSGYRTNDKELTGQMLISPWKSKELPYVKGRIEITEREPDIFVKNYFSNHYQWSNSFNKEKRFLLGGSIGADKWRFEAGYNIIHINDYIYFDTLGLPDQADKLTITSAYIQKDFKLGGLHFTNRVVWQANTNSDVLSLPTFSIFSALYFEYELVKNVLLAQIGANVFYRSKFYADNYSPATGQFYKQHEKQIGEYPLADAFINLKWKRAILYFKMDHVNQGYPNNEYFSTIHYPHNQRIFKLGVSWIFYD